MEVFPFTHPLHPLNQNPDCNPLCNACHYKTLNYLTQIERKQLWAHKQLSQWDKHLRSIKHAPPHRHLGYRSKTWLRTRIQDNNLSFGMLKSVKIAGIWEKEFIAWNTCPLHSPAITGFIEKFRKIFALLPLKIRHRMENNLMGIWIGEPHLVFISKTSELLEDLKNIGWSTLLSPSLNRVWFHVHDQVGRRVFGHLPIERIAGTNETPTHPIRAFRQVADELLTEARAKAVSALLKDQPQLVLDLYCGTGDLALLLPKQTSWIGIEMSQEAVHYANSLRQPTLSRHQAILVQ
jgi:tRNA/tmRNA/rRNA uracil-C5-methylase (TrmA/RlmC/RlmD family)